MTRRIAILYLALLFGFCVYRAATTSFSTDEAYSYKLYVGAERFNLFRQYDANLHFIHTLLCWISVRVFGLSELALRLPSLAGALVYFTAVFRLCSFVFRGPLFPAGMAVLTLNPLVLDHMSIARGYGLALGLFAWAFAQALSRDSAKVSVAVLLALSVATNFTFLFPSLAMIAVLALSAGRAKWQETMQTLTGPFLITAFLLLVLPLSRMNPGAFYFGSSSLTEMNQSLAEMSIGDRHLDAWFVNAIAIAAWAGSIIWLLRKRDDLFSRLACGTFAVTALAVLASHFVGGVPYPWARTGLYFLFLLPLAGLAMVRFAPPAFAILPAALAVVLASGIRPDRFLEWNFDAQTREMVREIANRRAGASVKVACAAPIHLTLGLYREAYGLDWMEPVESKTFAAGFPFYVLRSGDHRVISDLGLREIYRNSSGTVLATSLP